jgi:hypothetical protein
MQFSLIYVVYKDFTLFVQCCDVRYDFRLNTIFSSSLPPFVCRRYHILFTLFVFLRIVTSATHIVVCFVFCFCFVFILCLVCPMLPLSLDCPFLIAPSVFSHVYFDYFYYVWYRMKNKAYHTVGTNTK